MARAMSCDSRCGTNGSFVRLHGVRAVAIAALTLLVAACGTTADRAGSGRPSAPVTTETPRDCTVSWVDHFTSLSQLAGKAEVVVRAVAVSQDTPQLKAFAAGGVVSRYDARRTTFRVIDTLKGAPVAEIRVLETACDNLDLRPNEEWVLFLYRWDTTFGPDEGGEHFMTLGGPQGQVRVSGGRVGGPFYVFAPVIRSYEGAPIETVLSDVRVAVR